MVTTRLPEVKTLYELLPKGVEGGKEFARIVDLLLFHEARRAGKNITIFNDAAGDYHGLDSFESGELRRRGTRGYQYKFYPSPLSAEHRQRIEESLKRAAGSQGQLKINKWVLVTPQDLLEPPTRKDGGDVSWFEGLRKKLGLKFYLEHWGHKKLLSLFLETPALCLFYYPELIPNGATRKRTIQDTRQRYNKNLNLMYRNIEFVGMSVYKQEATRGVPMEDIYIPLSVRPDSADELDENAPRVNPLSLLVPGAKYVILGDPGSGKSTLQRFLALAGISEPLQKRYGAQADSRLPVFVILRRYADELKARKQLSLIDYIKENVQADFNLNSADYDFFEYYLEAGQAVLLFDGLDELPNSSFKQTVRDRIRSLITTYPGNTAIVTSRIVGYDNPFRFDDKEFAHYRLSKLQLLEIERFVADWYRVRIDNDREREANVTDLVRILRDENHTAIRELAENPLLLTIIALVHRIDAVLPDERVVLYQKCTETLLNTWHTWKFREEIKNRGKVERRNRRRMEAIANWMHCRSLATGKTQRAVAPYADLHKFLTRHISEVEKTYDTENDAEDIAEDFLDFVKKRAGLLIEAGDKQYSFVHQTFQEYLTSSHIITSNEARGVEGIWKTMKDKCGNPRWQEVIRLLVAALKSDESQRFLIEKVLSEETNGNQVIVSQLLGGFLLDGIEPAEDYREEILKRLLNAGSEVDDVEQIRSVTSLLRACICKDEGSEELASSAFKSLWNAANDDSEQTRLVLASLLSGITEAKIIELTGNFMKSKKKENTLVRLFLSETLKVGNIEPIRKEMEFFWAVQSALSMESPGGNFFAAACQAITASLDTSIAARKNFEGQMLVLSRGTSYGAFSHFYSNCLAIAAENESGINESLWDRARALDPALDQARDRARALDPALDRALDPALALYLDRTLALDRTLDISPAYNRKVSDAGFWQTVLTQSEFHLPILDSLCDIFAFSPKAQWWEALRVGFLPRVPQLLNLYKPACWEQVEKAFSTGKTGETEAYLAACHLLLDSWLYIFECYSSPDETIFGNLAKLTRSVDAPPLRIAHCIRDLAYGDESRADDLAAMVRSDDPEYRSIFEACYWRPTSEEEAKKNLGG